MRRPNGIHVENPLFTRHISYPGLWLHLYIGYIERLYVFTEYHHHLIQNSAESGIRHCSGILEARNFNLPFPTPTEPPLIFDRKIFSRSRYYLTQVWNLA